MTTDLFWLFAGAVILWSWLLLTAEFKRWPKHLRTYDRRKFLAFGGLLATAVAWWYYEQHGDGWTTVYAWALIVLQAASWLAENNGWFEN